MGVGAIVGGMLASTLLGAASAKSQADAAKKARRANEEAARRAHKLQQEQNARQAAQQEQANNKANAGFANAASHMDDQDLGNSANLTGGGGINPDDLLLGGVPSLLGKNDNDGLL